MKRVLVTAGPVYGPLDDNKLVGNRTRGIWATKFAEHLMKKGYPVSLLIADTDTRLIGTVIGEKANLEVISHRGYWDYAQKCEKLATSHDAAVMAAAVVNWIPAKPFPGKIPTAGYKEGDIMDIPFVLAPRVINRMRRVNPNLTLIGCKMLIGAEPEELIEAAYHVLLTAKCNVVVANDMGAGLRKKHLVYPDRAVFTYTDDFTSFYDALERVIEDVHYHTEVLEDESQLRYRYVPRTSTQDTFDRILDKYRSRFVHRQLNSDRVFGSLAVRMGPANDWNGCAFVSPREKGDMFSSEDAVVVTGYPQLHTVRTFFGKATLNAPLLVRVLRDHPRAEAVLHLHEFLPNVPTVGYAPPGTMDDNDRDIPGPAFNIDGHGFIACLDTNGEFLK